MKTSLATLARLAAFVAALSALSLAASAHEAAASDRAAQLLATRGTIELASAGPFVESGTFRIQVATKLGRPSAVLSDGTWLYANHEVENSRAAGTLVVRFDDRGRVSRLSLVTPAVATAMAQPGQARDKLLVASRQ